MPGTSKYLPLLLFVYRENYSTQLVLSYFSDYWRENLDNNFFVGAFLVNLSKAFDFILRDLVIAKLRVYHCVKSVRIQIYSGPYFPKFGINRERYPFRIQSECGEIRAIITPNTFQALYYFKKNEKSRK